ncbi:MAG: hypothetical protein KA271_02080 [Propionivibrio sp.]|jgi:hypothetical protein|nr:hypothetical protein [Propionivibrio sp.]
MNRTRIQIAKPDIVRHFDALPNHVLKAKEIYAILAEQRTFWRLAQNTTAERFIEFLEKYSKLKQYEFRFPQRAENCYVWDQAPLLAILLGLKKNLHFSHYTAMRAHGLTEQSPKSIYLTDERTASHTSERENTISQADIDNAFKKPARISSNWVEHDGKKIYLLNGADTGNLGVVTEQMTDESGADVQARKTNLERTLIDITVRPVYAGGVFEVAKAYELAKERVSINRLVAMLHKLSFVYPYHQAVGYYLKRANYKPNQIDLVRRLPMDQDFYLTHEMNDTRYDSDWRLHVPSGF